MRRALNLSNDITRDQALVSLRCDTLVIGAGPAGSSCAHWLARHGHDVALVDQHRFPRHKVCGDGLIPDTLEVLKRLGLFEEVMAQAQCVDHVRCIAPTQQYVDIKAPMAVISRWLLDELLVKAAVKHGASFHEGMRFEALHRDPMQAHAVTGAWFRTSGDPVFIKARQVVLATGASSSALEAAGVKHRRAPSAMAMRTVIRHPGLGHVVKGLQVIWHRSLSPGYAWLFPMPNQAYNLGVGVFDVAKHWPQEKINLRKLFQRLIHVNRLVARLVDEGTTLLPLKGAPLRSGLTGTSLSQDGLLVCGEAIGSTYGLTGEGIGKAMETGLLAADSILQSESQHGLVNSTIGAIYETALESFHPRYAQYEKANRINRQAWLAEVLIRLASRSRRLRFQASEVLMERRSPADLVTMRGVLGVLLK